jgi:two-component system, LytTR family, response regulator
MIRTLIVDDEPLARERLRTLLQPEPDIQIIGECADGRQAVISMTEQAPDLVFLDIQMPGLDGMGVLQAMTDRPLPVVVFVTAYDQYALQAFDVHALDYLLKPFTARRFQKALERARAAVIRDQATGGEAPVEQRLINLLDDLGGERRYSKRIVVKSSGRIHFVKVDEIDWVEAEGNYVRLHVGAHSHLLRETMKGMEAALDPERFIRIHRSTIVNTERIKELQPWFNGEYVVVLRNGTRLPLSRGYRDKLQERLGKGF